LRVEQVIGSSQYTEEEAKHDQGFLHIIWDFFLAEPALALL
jgi:hypothetical protein